MKNYSQFYTLTKTIQSLPEYNNILLMLERLINSGILPNLEGNCISAADIVQNLLSFYEIKSKTIECQAFLVKENNTIKDFCFVGANFVGVGPNSIDTHVINITETNPPILIDASLGHLLPEQNKIIIREVNSLDPDIIAKYQIGDVTLTYYHKKNIRLPALHQKNLVDKITDDLKIKKEIRYLKIIVTILVLLGLTNFTLNIIAIYLKLITM